MMNKSRFSILLALLIIFPAGYLNASDNDALYLKIDYFKAYPGTQSEYEDIELDLWKALHQERYDRGIIRSWNFYQVMAGEPDVPYEYVAINVFDDFDKIDYFDLEDIITSVYPDKSVDEVMEQTQQAREVVRTEIWEVNKKILDDHAASVAGEYLTINYFDSRGGSGEHEEMELEFWGPIHELRIDRDILNSWAMYTMLYPGGDARHYTYATIDYYDTLADMHEPVGAELAAIAHSDLNSDEIDDYFERTGKSRSLYKTELWSRLGSVGP